MSDLRRRTARKWQRATGQDEAGMAMIVVMSVMIILILLTTIVFNQAVAQLPLARHDQDHESALHAAESGVDDYVNHLNANNNYFSYGNVDATNAAFTGWQPLPGSALLPTNESFRYRVDNTGTAGTGIVYLTSSGCAAPTIAACDLPGAPIRTVRIGLRKVGFLDFVYFTDYELVDPVLSGHALTSCNFHLWDFNASTGGYGPANSCNDFIEFHSGDLLNGPVHSNDAFHMCGTPNFPVSIDSGWDLPVSSSVAGVSSFAGSGKVVKDTGGSCGSGPATMPAGSPTGSNEPFPATNLQLSNAADKSLGGNGCVYFGQTSINLHIVAGLPVMDVTNPYGSTFPTVGVRPHGTLNQCYKSTASPWLNLPLPLTQPSASFNGVVYVENVPSGSVSGSGCTVGTTCTGDLSIKGTLAGQMTVGADDTVNITGPILYNGPGSCNAATACQLSGTDVLGIVAGNDIVIQHPDNCSPNTNAGCLPNLTIDAALLSVQHSIYVDNWDTGAGMGLLTVNGTLAQKYRGAVGTTGGTGYTKQYSWDSRLRYLSPPYFLAPAQSSWEHISFSELVPDATP